MADIRLSVCDHVDGLKRYARMLTRNSSEVEDLVQESIMRALSTQHLWSEIKNLRAYLFTILHHLHADACARRVGNRAELSFDLIATPLATPPAQDDRLKLRDMARAMALLPAAQTQVVRLIVFEGLSYEETATQLGVPIGTIMSRLCRARASLRKMLSEDSNDGPKTVEILGNGGLKISEHRYLNCNNSQTE